MTEGGRPREHVADAERLVPDYVSRIDWPLASVEGERTNALRALLTAAARSPWHRRRLEGLDIASMSDRDIVDLPVMTKTDLMDNFDSVVTDTRLSRRICEEHLDRSPGDDLLGEFQVVASGGSSGTRGVYVFGWDAWATCYASNVRFQARDWLQASITDALTALGLAEPDVAIETVAALPRQASGKLKRFVPLVTSGGGRR